MTRTAIRRITAASLLIWTVAQAHGQMPGKHRFGVRLSDVAVTVNFERAQIAQVNGNRFWLKGGSVDASAAFFGGLGLAVNVTGEHAAQINPSIALGKLAYMVGPRYTADTSRLVPGRFKQHPSQVFVEALFGGVYSFDSAFPAGTSTSSTANAFSMQLGGGIDLPVKHRLGWRVVEADLVHTALPNNASDSQNDFRIATGISFRP